MDEINPFQSPAPVVEVVADDDIQFEYLRPFGFVFEKPNWVVNTLLLGVVQLIPLVGPVATLGYQYEIVIGLLRRPRQTYPDFDFNRFGDYLTRGIWPLLAMLVWGMLFGVLISGVMIAAGLVAALLAGDNPGQADAESIVAVVMGAVMAIFLCMMIAFQLLATPLILRSALEKNFMAGMSLGFALQFLSKTWKEMILMHLLMMLAAMLALFVGMLLFCVGYYFTLPIIFVAQAHVAMQLYRLHLARSGQAIYIAD